MFVLQGFYYANGVALAPDDSYVVMAETDMTRVHKVWVTGPKVRACGTLKLGQLSDYQLLRFLDWASTLKVGSHKAIAGAGVKPPYSLAAASHDKA